MDILLKVLGSVCSIFILYFVTKFAVKNALKESLPDFKVLMEDSTLMALKKNDYDKKE